jgi:predicted nucleic acid-binding Zn ribbon protein
MISKDESNSRESGSRSSGTYDRPPKQSASTHRTDSGLPGSLELLQPQIEPEGICILCGKGMNPGEYLCHSCEKSLAKEYVPRLKKTNKNRK